MIDGTSTVLETRVSARGSVSSWVVLANGRRVTVALPRGTDTPAEIADVAAVSLARPVRSGGRR